MAVCDTILAKPFVDILTSWFFFLQNIRFYCLYVPPAANVRVKNNYLLLPYEVQILTHDLRLWRCYLLFYSGCAESMTRSNTPNAYKIHTIQSTCSRHEAWKHRQLHWPKTGYDRPSILSTNTSTLTHRHIYMLAVWPRLGQ